MRLVSALAIEDPSESSRDLIGSGNYTTKSLFERKSLIYVSYLLEID
jgi:hypothetical protein